MDECHCSDTEAPKLRFLIPSCLLCPIVLLFLLPGLRMPLYLNPNCSDSLAKATHLF